MQILTRAQKKQVCTAEVLTGASPQEVATKYGVDIQTVRNWVKEDAKQASRDQVIDLDPVVVATVVNEIKDKAENSANITTKQINKLERGLDKLQEGLEGLELLESSFHTTIMNLLNWANAKIVEDMKVSEWTQLVNGITELHSTLFGKGSSTQINLMQQNNQMTSATKVDAFKSGFRS